MDLLILGGLLLVGLAADVAGRHSPLPRVTLLLLAGVLIGPSSLELIPATFVDEWFATLTQVALAMVGFVLGQKVTPGTLRRRGGPLIALSLGAVMGTAAVVAAALVLGGLELPLALILAGIATATAPAATLDVVRETRASGRFTDMLLGIVALDDAWALVLFSLMLVAAGYMEGANTNDLAIHAAREVLGSVALGIAIGIPMAYLTGRIRDGEPMQAEAFGFVLVGAGAAALLDLSPILLTMAMGSVVAQLARHHERPFRAIEEFEWPFFIVFFILAGASLELSALGGAAWLVTLYIAARLVGKVAGVHLAGTLVRYDAGHRRWLGLAMMPQAGVAIGLALIASQRLPDLAETILAVTLASTVILEVAAPVCTRLALQRVGEAQR